MDREKERGGNNNTNNNENGGEFFIICGLQVGNVSSYPIENSAK